MLKPQVSFAWRECLHFSLVGALAALGLVLGCGGNGDSPPDLSSESGGSGGEIVDQSSGGSGTGGGSNSSGGNSNVGGSGGSQQTAGSSGGAGLGGANGTGGAQGGRAGASVVPEAGSKNWVYLMLGQSNMEGSSKLEAEDAIAPARVFKLTKAKTWLPASEGVCLWRGELSPGRTFGMKLLEKVTDPDVNIFLINAAVGSTTIEQWNPVNGEHYLAMLPYLEEGMKKGTIRGFIWHQGESNFATSTGDYARMFTTLVGAIRAKVRDPNLPVVAGEIGANGVRNAVNDAIAQVATSDPFMRVSSSIGLTLYPDNPHYISASERLMGEKMAAAWWSIRGK